jgi:hypothetical protein
LISAAVLTAAASVTLVAAAGAPAAVKPTGEPVKAVWLDSATYQGTEGFDSSVSVSVVRSTAKGAANVMLTTGGGTATAGVDYTAVNTTVSFASGETSKTVSVPLLADGDLGESDETVNLALSNPKSLTLDTPSTAVLTIHEPAELVTNGGFEAGSFSGWATGTGSTCLTPSGCTLSNAMPAPSLDGGTMHSGSKSAFLGQAMSCGTDAAGSAFLSQDVAVPGTGRTQLGFWYMGQSQDRFAFDGQQALVQDTSGNTLATVFNQVDASLTWKHVTFDLTPYAGNTVRLFFRVYGDGYTLPDCTGMNVDDVSVLNG